MIDDSRSTVFKWKSTDVFANDVGKKTGTPTRLDILWLRIRPKISELLECFECFKAHPSLTEDRVSSFLEIYLK